MGLAVRVIPTLLKRGAHLVKGKRFSADRVVGHVEQAARIHQARGVDELIILDVAATLAGRGPDFAAIESLTAKCFMPLTVGGGVRSITDVEDLLRAGADKVAIKTAYLRDPRFLMDAKKRFGSQAIVASVDWEGSFLGLETRCMALAALGAGELLLTAVEREGTMEGYDLELIRTVANAVSIPVIAHGGCSGPEDMLKAIQAGASAVAAGALFQFTDWTPGACAGWLHDHGVEVRL